MKSINIQNDPIWSLYFYIPKHKGNDEISQYILKYKDKDPGSFIFFTNEIKNWIEKYLPFNEAYICSVPSSKKDWTNSITLSAQKIALELPNIVDGTNFIKAKSSRKSFCKYGNRSSLKIIDSLMISEDVANKNIILIDDVACTGISLSTIKALLLSKNAKSVCCFAIAQTPLFR